MRGNPVLCFAACILLASFFSCSDNGGYVVVKPDVVEKGDTARKTLLVYMMAENSLSNYAASDVAEIMEAVTAIPSDCRLFVYVDDREQPLLTQYFRMTDGTAGNSAFQLFGGEVCSSDTAALGKVLDYILSGYPTESLDLVLWSHGDGWLRGPHSVAPQRSIGIDNGKNSYSDVPVDVIEIEELASLLETLPVKIDKLLFDACFMQCAEVAYTLRHSARWVIASPAEIPAPGAPYDRLIPLFFDKYASPDDIICEYVNAYEGESSGVVLSAVSTAGLERLASVTEDFVTKYFSVEKNRSYIDVFSYLPGGKRTLSKIYPCYYDFNAVMKRFLTPEEYGVWKSAFDETVPFIAASEMWYSAIVYRLLPVKCDVCGAVSLYMPQKANAELNQDFATTEWHMAAGWSEAGW